MLRTIFSVRDSASQLFGQPFFQPSAGIAIRILTDEVNRDAADNNLHKHPEDFELYKIGQFDDETGEINGFKPELVVRCKDILKAKSG